MKPLDPALLERVWAALEPADAIALSAALEPAWRVRQRRLAARDQEVARTIRRHYAHLSLLTAARALARDLRHYLWVVRAQPDWDSATAEGDDRTSALRRIAILTRGAEVGARTIWDAAKNNDCGCSGEPPCSGHGF